MCFWQESAGSDKLDFHVLISIDHSKGRSFVQEWISEKQSGPDIYSSSLISIGFDKFHGMARYLL